ncbi:hypothetical protein DV738_g1477, partial [Chaetothyriales sp. CBS 135597]
MSPLLIEQLATDSDSSTTPPVNASPGSSTDQHAFEPIAIIGMACRWPGDSESGQDLETPSAFWDFLEQRKDAYSDFPASRLNVDAWYHPSTNRPGSFYTRGGAFLKADVRDFDPTFFGINPQEATSMDPAQRKFLEVVYEALESSGTPLDAVSGSKTGCFVGNFNYDHQLMQYRDTEYPEPYGITGGGIALLSNRVSYVFNLQGPSLTLDTACSSSMYALHLACNAIQTGECDASIVGGSNLILTPECQVFSSALGAVSKTSKCHTFDAAADGYARADGIGALFVKSLHRAILDGDPIRAIIRGTAINANGKTGGITHPDPDGQEKVIRRAYQRAGLDPALTAYFECHGTGTPVGDPLEVEAVGRVFATKTTAQRPLLIGSVKSNLGHSESASGMAGIMKSVLALERGVIPPIRALNKLNPNVNLCAGKLKIVEEHTPWPSSEVRRASVNSFGYGGANAHTILEAADYLVPGRAAGIVRNATTLHEGNGSHFSNRAEVSRRNLFLLPFSAHNSRTLKSNIDALQPTADEWDLRDLAYTLSCRRTQFSTRSFAVVQQGRVKESLLLKDMAAHKALLSKPLRLAFVFTGQGAQWPQMGLELMESFPTYLKSIRDMDDILHSFHGCPNWSIEDSLRVPPESSKVYQAALSQTLVTAIQVALVDLLASWDIKPSVTVGHSSGEMAAVYASGRISAGEAIITAYARGQAVSHNKSKGAMLAVGVSLDAIAAHLERFENVTIACYNSPESITLSGNLDEVTELKALLDAEGIFARILATDGNAYHSSHMKRIGTDYEDFLKDLLLRLNTVLGNDLRRSASFVSSVTGKTYGKQTIGPDYWRANLESPVLFSQAVKNLVNAHPVDQLIEIGPHSALQGPLRQIAKATSEQKFPEYNATLVRKSDGTENLLTLAGTLFCKGHEVNLTRVNAIEALDSITNSLLPCDSRKVLVDLPKYQWTYGEKFYFENRWTREWRLRTHPRHDILGSRSPGGNWREPTWRNVLKLKDLPWLKDHKIGPDIVFPTAAYLAMAVEAATQLAEISDIDVSSIRNYELRHIRLETALIIAETGGTEILFSLRPTRLNKTKPSASIYDFTVTSVAQTDGRDIFVEHASGQIALTPKKGHEASLAPTLSENKKPVSSSRWYHAFSRAGLNYGPTFRSLSDTQIQSNSFLAQGSVSTDLTQGLMTQESRYVIHPTVLDSTLQLAILAGHDGRATKLTTAYLPVAIDRLVLFTPRHYSENYPIVATAQANQPNSRELVANLTLDSVDGEHILRGSGLVLKASDTSLSPAIQNLVPYTRLAWRPDVSLLSGASKETLYPSTSKGNGEAELAILDQLALHQIIQFKVEYPEFFAKGSSVPHLQRFLSWMSEKADLASNDGLPNGVQIVNYTTAERQAEIERLEAASIEEHGPESRLMCHMYRSLPSIYRGEITGIHAAVQDHLLDDMYAYMKLYHNGSVALKDLVVLLSHKNPKLSIFEVGGGTGSATREVLPALNGDKAMRGYNSYTFSDIGTAFLAAAQDVFREFKGVVYVPFDMQRAAESQGFGSDYDLIIASNVIHATTNIQTTLQNIRSLLKPGGKLVLFEFIQPRLSWNMILGTFSDFWNGDADPKYPRTEGPFLTQSIWEDVLPKSGFSGVDLMLDHFAQEGEAAAVIMTTAVGGDKEPPSPPLSKPISVVYRGEPSSFVRDFVEYLESAGTTTDLVPLSDSTRVEGSRAIFLVEIEEPILFDIKPSEWQHLRDSLVRCESALYVTRGGLLDGGQPDFAMMSGLVCAIHTENRSSKLVTVDLDTAEGSRLYEFDMLLSLEERAAAYLPGDDFEYRCRQGIAYVSRLEADEQLNAEPSAAGLGRTSPVRTPLAELHNKRMAIALESGNVSDPISFEEETDLVTELEAHAVEVEVFAADVSQISPGDVSTLFSGGFAGVVVGIGPAVTHVKAGDKVFGLTTSRLGTFIRTDETWCVKLRPEDTFEGTASTGSAFCSALYTVHEIGRLSPGERILIDSATSSVGLAACQITRMCRAEIYVVVEPGNKSLAADRMDLSEDHLFDATEGLSVDKMLSRTNGSGFNVILSSNRDEEEEDMDKYCQLLAPYGRFIHLGRTEAHMGKLGQNVTLSSFDPISLTRHQPAVISNLLKITKDLYTGGQIQPLQQQTVALSDIGTLISSENTATPRSAILTFDSRKDMVSVVPAPYEISFDPEASYLLVGCIGGLGRRLAAWMASRGARKMTFLSRSGASSRSAKLAIQDLEQRLSVEVRIVQGDVSSPADVWRAVQACRAPLKGVVQAALTLHDAFFSQANYMAANAYMDSLAAWRRRRGQRQSLPAASLGLGQILDIGIVSEVPAYQEHLHRMGLHGVDEDAFLRSCEAALRHQTRSAPPPPTLSIINPAHILSGVDPAALLENAEHYPLADMSWYADPRFGRLVQSVAHLASSSATTTTALGDNPSEEAIVRIHKKLARLLYVPREDIDPSQPIKKYGIDSMVAAELRNWVFGAFGKDVSLLKLLSPAMSVGTLAASVTAAE